MSCLWRVLLWAVFMIPTGMLIDRWLIGKDEFPGAIIFTSETGGSRIRLFFLLAVPMSLFAFIPVLAGLYDVIWEPYRKRPSKVREPALVDEPDAEPDPIPQGDNPQP